VADTDQAQLFLLWEKSTTLHLSGPSVLVHIGRAIKKAARSERCRASKRPPHLLPNGRVLHTRERKSQFSLVIPPGVPNRGTLIYTLTDMRGVVKDFRIVKNLVKVAERKLTSVQVSPMFSRYLAQNSERLYRSSCISRCVGTIHSRSAGMGLNYWRR
jgi:hypothetical protein